MYLREVFKHLEEAGHKLKPNKYDLCVERAKFLGYIESAEGVQADPEKTEKVAHWHNPHQREKCNKF